MINLFEYLNDKTVFTGREDYPSFAIKANKEIATSIMNKLCEWDKSCRFTNENFHSVRGAVINASYYKELDLVQIEGVTVNEFRKHFRISNLREASK